MATSCLLCQCRYLRVLDKRHNNVERHLHKKSLCEHGVRLGERSNHSKDERLITFACVCLCVVRAIIKRVTHVVPSVLGGEIQAIAKGRNCHVQQRFYDSCRCMEGSGESIGAFCNYEFLLLKSVWLLHAICALQHVRLWISVHSEEGGWGMRLLRFGFYELLSEEFECCPKVSRKPEPLGCCFSSIDLSPHWVFSSLRHLVLPFLSWLDLNFNLWPF